MYSKQSMNLLKSKRGPVIAELVVGGPVFSGPVDQKKAIEHLWISGNLYFMNPQSV